MIQEKDNQNVNKSKQNLLAYYPEKRTGPAASSGSTSYRVILLL
jgi:hypothetical protein